jgi:hypothetical protein
MTEAEEKQKAIEADRKLVEEWLAEGNEIEVIPYGKRSDELTYHSGMYAKRKKKGNEGKK